MATKNKQKTRKSVIKRFKVTKTGKIMRGHNFARHLSVKKSANRKRALRKPVEVKESFARRLRKALGVRRPAAAAIKKFIAQVK